MQSITLLNPLNILTEAKSAVTINTDLIIVGFFKYEIGEPELTGEVKELNDGLKGLIMKYRTDGTFSGGVGKSFLFRAPEDTIAAKNVMLLGLGKRSSFNLNKMKTAGCIAWRNAVTNSFEEIAFALEIIIENISSFTASELAEAYIEGVMNEYIIQKINKYQVIEVKGFRILIKQRFKEEALKGITIALAKFQYK